ncbi:MAG: GTPase HflX [Burkholderiaceae bacterium]|nr:GTPase HflX [Burkholderiaceae bacterium]
MDKNFTPVLLVGVDLGAAYFDRDLVELGLLAESAGMRPVARMVCKRKAPDAALFIGSGKADEIRVAAQLHGAIEVLFDQSLSPAQQRNLERHLELPVNDRTLLILQIFAERARSHEGKLQVQLAKLQYVSTRLVRRWSHLERQMGGIGARGGPGEKQIELDRRMIGDAIKNTKERLAKLKRQRATQRRSRERSDTFSISLVGYTNAGKSTLFNALAKARAYTEDKLFATLDTTTRRLYLSEANCSVSLSDTVGFIRDLPHGLVEAFQATLQEVVDADLLVHVVDGSSLDVMEQMAQVDRVLLEIGASTIPQILVFNKIDQLPQSGQPASKLDWFEGSDRRLQRLFLSAKSGEGLSDLRVLLAGIARTRPLDMALLQTGE